MGIALLYLLIRIDALISELILLAVEFIDINRCKEDDIVLTDRDIKMFQAMKQ
jgi:hypothetical protein